MMYLGIMALISSGITFYLYLTGRLKPGEIDPLEHLPEAPELAQEPSLPPKLPSMTKREHLYDTAYNSRGKDMSPLDRAPDSLGCMESLDGVFFAAFGEHLLSPENRLSTKKGYQSMLNDPRLEVISNEEALPGDIVMSPTGSSTKGAEHGHCGVRGKTAYMSNDSNSGLWMANYNLPNWELVFHKTLGFPVIHFRVKGDMV